jgi:hypothetical protein
MWLGNGKLILSPEDGGSGRRHFSVDDGIAR